MACSATSGSWVMSTTVRPSSLSRAKMRSTSSVERESRLPVGSSARIIVGFVTSARATATRCCWPPESSDGLMVNALCHPDRGERLLRAPAARVPVDAGVGERQFHVREGGRARDEVEALKDEADLAVAQVGEIVLVHVAHVDAVDQVAPAGRQVEAAEDVHQRALAAAGAAHDRDEVASLDPQGDLAQRADFDDAEVVGLGHADDDDRRRPRPAVRGVRGAVRPGGARARVARGARILGPRTVITARRTSGRERRRRGSRRRRARR